MALTSIIRYIKVLDTASTTGAGLTGKAFGDFTAKYVVDGGTLTSLTTETITTLGTYQAPTSSAHIRIKELNSAAPTDGLYEVHFHNTTLATGTRLVLALSLTGGRVEPYELDLENVKSVNLAQWLGTAPLALSSQQVQAIVPDTQKVDVNTIKTNPVVNGGTITFPTGATLASTTNITAGTITTATNVTTVNGLANNVITAASTAADFIAEIKAQADQAATDYGALKPTTAGRTLDVSAAGNAGIDWGNVENPTTTVDLSGTNIAITQKVDLHTIKTQTVTAATGVTFPTIVASDDDLGAIFEIIGPLKNMIEPAFPIGYFKTEVFAQSGLGTAAELAKVPKSDGTVGWNATARAQIQSEAEDAIVARSLPTLAQILAGGDIDGYTLEESHKLILAACAGILAGAATTTNTMRAADNSKVRITATVDADGNRSAITLDATG